MSVMSFSFLMMVTAGPGARLPSLRWESYWFATDALVPSCTARSSPLAGSSYMKGANITSWLGPRPMRLNQATRSSVLASAPGTRPSGSGPSASLRPMRILAPRYGLVPMKRNSKLGSSSPMTS